MDRLCCCLLLPSVFAGLISTATAKVVLLKIHSSLLFDPFIHSFIQPTILQLAIQYSQQLSISIYIQRRMRSARPTSMRCFRSAGKREPCTHPKKNQQIQQARYSSTGHQQHRPNPSCAVRCYDSHFRLSTRLAFEWRNHNRPSTSYFRAFSVKPAATADETNYQTEREEPTIKNLEGNESTTCIEAGEFHSPFLGPCHSQLAVTPTPRGYAFEIMLRPRQEQHQKQQRQFSQSSSGDGTNDPIAAATSSASARHLESGSDNMEARKEQRKERRRRLAVYYPYNEQDIRRKQKIRKERKRKRTIANVNRALLGNVVIAGSKLAAWFCSQSSSMMSEFIHSVVDCANQYLLLQGLRDSSNAPDRKHPYGYGKSVYFWALVSALGTFFMGFGISMSHAWGELM